MQLSPLIDIAENAKDIFRPATDLQKAMGRIAVIADAAHSFGAIRENALSGEAADFTVFSFHAVKNLTTAEGGAVVWRDINGADNAEIYNSYMLWSLHGQSKDALAKTKLGAWEYDIKICGYKCNMTDILASIGHVQLDRYKDILQRRRHIISIYDGILKDKVDILPHYSDSYSSSGHLYLTNVKGANEIQRNDIITAMAEKGIATNVHYKPLPMHTAYKTMGYDIANYPNAYERYKSEITLPLHTLLSDEQAEYVAVNYLECIRKIIK